MIDQKKKPTLKEAIARSETFIVLGTKEYLRDLHKPNSEVAVQARIAKKLNKSVIFLLTNKLSQADKIELERLFSGYNVISEIELDLDDNNSWEAVIKEIVRLSKKAQVNKVLKRTDFIRIDMDPVHYYYSFRSDTIEICLEICAGGFCVAAYDEKKQMIEPRKCVNEDGYLSSPQAMFGERKEDTWNKALEIANDLYKRLIVAQELDDSQLQ